MLWSTNPPLKNLQDIPSRALQSDQSAGVIGPFIDSPAEIAESTPEFENVEWMLSLLPPLEPAIADTTPALAKNSMIFLLRVFRTWPNMISKGFQLPPLFHSTVIGKSPLPLPLANCFTLTKMWSGQYEGSYSIARETILKETKSLIHDLPTYDEIYLLAALQALTIYNIMLLFPSKDQNSIPELDQSIFHGLQQAVFRTAGTGLILQEETSSTIPSWEAWIHVTSKRRAVFVLYILHWAYSVYHHLPSFNCEEIGFMPGPAAKFLWNASSRQQWEWLYSGWLLQWDGEPFLQHEFINVKPGVGVDRRVQLWLEDTDELGILFMSIVNTTEREPEFATNMYTARNGGIHIS